MTTFLFWENPYLTTLDTYVSSIEGDQVIFAQTIAYAESGGQESDRAKVNGIEILESRLDPERRFITYTLPCGHPLREGDPVFMEIDWARRYRLMRLHFACELILVLMNRTFGEKGEGDELRPEEIDRVGIEKVGAHMSEDKARIDFELAENIELYFPRLQEDFKRIVDQDIPIETGYICEKERKRYWRIEGLATVPCGGTHVKTTSEVGYVHLKRKRANKGIERVYITLQ